ncbi:hypothetical protein [Tortoise microvirus 11]|nr:hypothetical protein [Tortoise microvirus 11]
METKIWCIVASLKTFRYEVTESEKIGKYETFIAGCESRGIATAIAERLNRLMKIDINQKYIKPGFNEKLI